MRSNSISVISNRRHISLPTEDILYIQLAGRLAVIHASGGRTYETYTTIEELEQMLDKKHLPDQPQKPTVVVTAPKKRGLFSQVLGLFKKRK